MLPVAQVCVRPQPLPDRGPDPAHPPAPPAGLHLLPSELLAHIVRFLCTDARHAFARTGRYVYERVARDVVIARLEQRVPQVGTLSTLRGALPDATDRLLSACQQANWLGRLAQRLSCFPSQPALTGARALLDKVQGLPAEGRGEPLIALMNGMSFGDLLDPLDGFRDGILAQIMALPLPLQAGPLSRYLHLLPADALRGQEVRGWVAHIGRLPASEQALLLTKLAESSKAFDAPWTDGGHAELLGAVTALPAAQRVPVLCVVGVHLGRAMDNGSAQRHTVVLRCWDTVFEAASRLPEAAASEVLVCLATHLSRHGAAHDDCWERLWARGNDMLQTPEHRASWLASMAYHACTGANWPDRWARVWQCAAAMPRPGAAVAYHLAHALRDVADDNARQPRWRSLLELAPALSSAGRAKLLKRLAAVLQAQPTPNDEGSWEALIKSAQTLDPLDGALVLVACMDDMASAQGLWGTHLRQYASLSPEQVAKALQALATKLALLCYPERRVGACLDMLRAIEALPLPLQREPALALAGPITTMAAERTSVGPAIAALLQTWPPKDRLEWLLAASASVADHDEADWLMARLTLVPPWMRAWPVAELANWAAQHADLEDDIAADVWIGLCVACAEIPAQYRGAMLPAMHDFWQSLPDAFRDQAGRDLDKLMSDVPACDLPESARSMERPGSGEAARGAKRARIA